MQPVKKILSTRLLDEKCIRQYFSEKLHIDCLPFIETGYQTAPLPAEAAFFPEIIWIFTSQNAVKGVHYYMEKHGHPLQVAHIACTSGKTRLTVKRYFPEAVIMAEGKNATDICRMLTPYLPHDRKTAFIFAKGNISLPTIPAFFKKNQYRLIEWEVYQTMPRPHPLDTRYDAILFFSPSAVKAFFSNNTADEATVMGAIGSTTARALTGENIHTGNIITAPTPLPELLLQLTIKRLCNGAS